MERNASVHHVYPASRIITGEGRAEFLRTWGDGFEQEAPVGGHIEYLPKKLYQYCLCRVVICSVRRTPDTQQPTHAKRFVRKRQKYRLLVTHP